MALARVAELVDALDLGSSARKGVRVQVLPRAFNERPSSWGARFFSTFLRDS